MCVQPQAPQDLSPEALDKLPLVQLRALIDAQCDLLDENQAHHDVLIELLQAQMRAMGRDLRFGFKASGKASALLDRHEILALICDQGYFEHFGRQKVVKIWRGRSRAIVQIETISSGYVRYVEVRSSKDSLGNRINHSRSYARARKFLGNERPGRR
jgi:hypothetical protein